jgi:3-oxoacyl-ACP reductase-like protein
MSRNIPFAMSFAYGTQNPYLSRPDVTWTDEERKRFMDEKRVIARYKTSLCTDFKESGICRWGNNCRFAHGPEELREKPVSLLGLFNFSITIYSLF